MARAVIEIGEETTSLLVAETDGGRLSPLLERRQQLTATRLGARAMASVVESEAAIAREAGAASVLVVIAPELKGSHFCRGLGRRLGAAGLGPVPALTAAERGSLAFLGITAAAGIADREASMAEGEIDHAAPVCVVEISSTVTTFAVGGIRRRPRWWASRPLHAKRLLASGLCTDPPSAAEYAAALELARRQLSTLMPPRREDALLAGPEAGSLALLCGDLIDAEACRRATGELTGQLSEIVAARLDIEPPAARRLPALLAIAQAAGELIGRPLRIVHGGLAEGLLLQQATEIGSHEAA